jgi:hypothetical protein
VDRRHRGRVHRHGRAAAGRTPVPGDRAQVAGSPRAHPA